MRITAREVTRKNPWGGIAGCIYLGRADGSDSPGYFLAGARSAQQRVCATPELVRVATAASGAAPLPRAAPTALRGEPGPADAVDDPRWMVPPSLLTLLQPLESLRQTSGALYRVYAEGEQRSARARRRRGAGLAQPRRPRRRAGRRRLLDRRHDRSGAAGARPEDRCLLHRTARRLPCAGHAPRRGPRPAARRAAARRRDGADGRGRRHRHRQRPDRGARRRALAVRAPGGRRPRPRRRLRHPPAVSRPLPRRRAPQCRRLPRRDAGLDDQADHGGGVPRRPRRARQPPARERARGDAEGRHAGARQPARPADAIRLGALPRPHVLHRAGLRGMRPAVGSAGGGTRVRLERRLRRRRRELRQGRPPVRRPARPRRRARLARPRRDGDRVRPRSSASRSAGSSARRSTSCHRRRSTPASCAAAPPAPMAAASATTTGRSARAARSSTSSPRAGARATRVPACSASPA